MNLNQWLIVALRDLDPQARARLETEYTAHFREALDAAGGEAQALATLGDAGALNEQLKRQYLTADEGAWLDRYASQVARPYWGWMVAAGLPMLAYSSDTLQTQFWLTALSSALVLVLRALLLRFASARRAALAMATVIIPAIFIGPFGLSFQRHWVSLMVMVVMLGFVYIPRRHIWLKVLRRA